MEIRIYWTDVRGLSAERPEIRRLLSENRLQKLAELNRVEDVRRSIGAELALALGMADVLQVSPLPVPWQAGENGKPYLPGSKWHFNLSHAEDIAVCAICDIPVGADVEAQRYVRPALARRVLSAQEQDCPPDMLLTKWVAKESYLKLTGEGIRRPMTEFSAQNGGIWAPDGRRLAYLTEVPLERTGYALAVCTQDSRNICLRQVQLPI